jgi:hypothetical protein
MKSVDWKTYRTRFLVKAKQLSSNLTFVDPLGRQHAGRKGDYLVESDGMLRIAPRQIFEDIYVAIAAEDANANDEQKTVDDENRDRKNDEQKNDEPLVEGQRKPAQKIASHPHAGPAPRRKLPQPFRQRGHSGNSLGMM